MGLYCVVFVFIVCGVYLMCKCFRFSMCVHVTCRVQMLFGMHTCSVEHVHLVQGCTYSVAVYMHCGCVYI